MVYPFYVEEYPPVNDMSGGERKSSDISTVTIADDTSIVSAEDECS